MVNQTGVLTLPRKQAAPQGVGIETSAIRLYKVTEIVANTYIFSGTMYTVLW